MIYPLDSELAKEIGVLEAIILVQFRYWIERNIANEQNYHDGNWWTYNSMVAFQRMFPFASEKSIRNALKHLEEKGLIVTGNYNKLQYDRTKWYALTPLGITHTDNFTDSIRKKGQMETEKRANGNGKKGRPIPNKIPNKEPKNISSSLRSEDIYIAEFENLWELYPRKQGKKDALKKYIKVRTEGTSYEEVEQGIRAYVEYIVANRKEDFIKMGSSFFNQEAWQDDWSYREEQNNGRQGKGTDFGASDKDTGSPNRRDRNTPPPGFKF